MSEESKGVILPAALIAAVASAGAALLLMACGSDDAGMALAASSLPAAPLPRPSGLQDVMALDGDPSGPTQSLPAASRHFAIYSLFRAAFDGPGRTSGVSEDGRAEKSALPDGGSFGDAVAACSMRAMIMQE